MLTEISSNKFNENQLVGSEINTPTKGVDDATLNRRSTGLGTRTRTHASQC
jgi:hypothetical protein